MRSVVVALAVLVTFMQPAASKPQTGNIPASTGSGLVNNLLGLAAYISGEYPSTRRYFEECNARVSTA